MVPREIVLRLHDLFAGDGHRVHVEPVEPDAADALRPRHRAGFGVVLVPTWYQGQAACVVHWQKGNEPQRAIVSFSDGESL